MYQKIIICIPCNSKIQFEIIYKEICTVWYEHGNNQGFNKWFVCASASASSPHRNILHELSWAWRRYRPYCMLLQHLGRVPACLLWQLKYYFGRIKIFQVHENAPETKCSYSWSSLSLPWWGVPSPCAEVPGGKAPASHLSFASHGAISKSPQGSWSIKLALIRINL